jgi:hypothetical protein
MLERILPRRRCAPVTPCKIKTCVHADAGIVTAAPARTVIA